MVFAITASLAASAAAPSAFAVAATRAPAVPMPLPEEPDEHVPRGAGSGQAGDVGVGGGRHPVADHEDGPAAGLGLGVERHRVLVAGVAYAAVADPGHPGGRLLGEVVARASAPWLPHSVQ